MPRARWSQFAPILAIAALVAVLALWATRSTETPDFSAASRQLDADFRARIRAVAAAYQSGNATAHARATAATLRLMNRASIRALLPEVDRLVDAISTDGLAPYQSIAIEFAYRLARIDQPKTQEKFRALARAALAPPRSNTASLSAKSRILGLIRGKGKLSYRQVDIDTAQAAGQLIFSEFGRTQFMQGQTPYDLLRTTAMAWECQRGEIAEAPRSEAARKSCKEFVDHLSRQLADSGQGALLPAAMSHLEDGTRMHTFPCTQRELSGQEFVEAVEAYAACMSNQSRPPRGSHVDGASVTTDWDGTPPELPGHTHVSSQTSVRLGPNGNAGVQVAHQYTNETGGTATVTNYSVTVDGRQESGTFIVTDDGAGNTHQERQNSQGEVTSSFTQHSDGSTDTFQRNDDGSTFPVTTGSDGTTHITVTDSKGNVTTATIKENGDCTGEACSTSMPDDESGASEGCNLRAGGPRDSGRVPSTDPLGPYIYPMPDSASGSPLLACVARSVGTGSTTPRCPPSVAFCLEPPPFGSCGCGTPFHGGGPIDPAREACSQIQCPDGSSCDPGTGVCRSYSPSGGLGAFSPGAKPLPRPSLAHGRLR
jgi:hypothetical protein